MVETDHTDNAVARTGPWMGAESTEPMMRAIALPRAITMTWMKFFAVKVAKKLKAIVSFRHIY